MHYTSVTCDEGNNYLCGTLPMKDSLPGIGTKAKKSGHQLYGKQANDPKIAGKGYYKNTSLQCLEKSGIKLQNHHADNELKRSSDNALPEHSKNIEKGAEYVNWKPRFNYAFREGLSMKDFFRDLCAKKKEPALRLEDILTYQYNSNRKENIEYRPLSCQGIPDARPQNEAGDESECSADDEIDEDSTSIANGVHNMIGRSRSTRGKESLHGYYAYKSFEAIPLRCEICDVAVNEVEPLFAHFNCSKHKKNMNDPKIRMFINFDEYSRRLDLMREILNMRKRNIYECNLCSAVFHKRKDYKAHKKSQIHLDKLFKSCYSVVISNDGKKKNMHLDFKFRL